MCIRQRLVARVLWCLVLAGCHALTLMIGGCGGSGDDSNPDYDASASSRYYPLRTGDVYFTEQFGLFYYPRRTRVAEEVDLNGVRVFRVERFSIPLTHEEKPFEAFLTKDLERHHGYSYMTSDENGVRIHGSSTVAYSPPLMVHIVGKKGSTVTQEYTVTPAEGEPYTLVRRTEFLGTETVTTKAGTFTDCARIRYRISNSRYDGYNPDNYHDQWYAPGIGLVRDAYYDAEDNTEFGHREDLAAAIIDGVKIP